MTGLVEDSRKGDRLANKLIKNGHVYIDNLRVANTEALYVLTNNCILEIRSPDRQEKVAIVIEEDA